MNLNSIQHGSVDVVKIPQRLVMANAPSVRKDLLELIAQGHRHLVLDLGEVTFVDSSGLSVLDLGEVTFVDSSGLSVLVSALKAANKNAGSVVLLNLTNDVRALIELTRMHEVFQIFADEQAAIDQLNQEVAA